MLTLAVALFAICSASANSYVVNDAAIDALVSESVEMVDFASQTPAVSLGIAHNPVVAAVFSWCLGWCGVHRYYLGTAPWMVLPYLLTGGGFGVVWVVDTVMLVIDALNNTINPQYINNERVLMWANLF